MKKLILMLMLCAPMTMMAQKFGKVNTQQIMQSLPDVAKANGELEALQKQKENDLKSMQDEFQRKADEYQKGASTMNATAKQQKETFTSLVSEALGEEADLEVVKNIHENLEQIIEEKKQESPAPVMLDKTEMKDLLEKSGVKEERLENFEEHFEMAAGEHGKLVASNVSSGKKFEVKTPDVVIKINSDKTDIVSTQVIDGRQCLVIQIDERLEVNGISVNPDTGEVIDRTADGYVEE